MKSDDLVDAVAVLKHGEAQRWGCFPELRVGTGYGKHAEGRVDLWAVALWPSDKYMRYAYEMKVSRSDFVRDIKDPMKQRAALTHSNYFYFVVPCDFREKGARESCIIKPEDLPLYAGLIQVRERGKGEGSKLWGRNSEVQRKYEMRVAHPAPYRFGEPPTPGFLATLARRVVREVEGETVG
jgi:hypothetical protein